MQDLFHILHILICIALIGFILIQHGKGADMGSSFGGGGAGTIFGSQGAGNFLTRTTTILGTGFFLTSLILAYFTSQMAEPTSVIDSSVPASIPSESAVPMEAIQPSSDVPTPDDVPKPE